MADVDLSAVLALVTKAEEWSNSGYHARAAEYYSAAVDAARTLPQPPDSLMVACLQAHHALESFLHSCSEVLPRGSPEKLRVLRVAMAIRDAVASTLQRRRAADTLFSAWASSAEAEFALAFDRLLGGNCNNVFLFVYDVFMQVAGGGLTMQSALWNYTTPRNGLAAAEFPELAPTQQRARFDFAADALDLMTQATRLTVLLPQESILVERVLEHECAGDFRALAPSSERIKLAQAWQRLLHSGMLQQRHVEERVGAARRRMRDLQAAADAEAFEQGLRTCALASCGAREAHVSHFGRCTGCKLVVYCCKAHHVADWPAHKKACKAARTASARKTVAPAPPEAAAQASDDA